MKTLLGKLKSLWFVAFCLIAILVIIACNLWALFHGHCDIHDFLRIPPIGWMLILANLVSGLVLYLVKHRKGTKQGKNICATCHTGLRDVWTYCPNCGGERCD